MRDLDILESWKEIADYLKKSERTCRRWEQEFSLPIHRLDGSPKARVFAYKHELDTWIQEMLDTVDDSEKSGISIKNLNKPLTLTFLVVACCLIGVILWAAFFSRSDFSLLSFFAGRAPAIDSIAVLPLENLSGDPEQDYFADSLTDLLTADLYKISALRVIPPQSIRVYKDTSKSPKEIARELNVKAIVQGSVQRSENRIRLIARLIDPIHDRQIWAETFDREISDVFFLQSDLSQAIIKGIRVVVTPEESARLASARKVNAEAFDLFLKGRNLIWRENEFSLNIVLMQIDYFNRAIEIDPDFALAYAYKANCYWELLMSGLISEQEVNLHSETALTKALELDEKLAMAHVFLAWHKTTRYWDFAGAEREFKRALELEPENVDVQHHYNEYLLKMGRFDEAIERQKRLENSKIQFFQERLVFFYFCAKRYIEGLEAAKKSFKMRPNSNNLFFLTVALGLNGMYAEALSKMETYMTDPEQKDDNLNLTELARLFALMGRREAAFKTMEKIKSQSDQNNIDSSVMLAAIYFALDDKDSAFELLYKAYKKHSGMIVYINSLHWFHSLHDDPRFEDLVKKVGFPEVH